MIFPRSHPTLHLNFLMRSNFFSVPGAEPKGEGAAPIRESDAPARLQWMTEASDVIAAIEPILGHGIPLAEVREPAQDALQKNSEPGPDDRYRIVSLLGPTPVSIDTLVRLAQTTPAIVRAALLELEIAGRIERHGAGLVSLL